jgi:hypothetical protein
MTHEHEDEERLREEIEQLKQKLEQAEWFFEHCMDDELILNTMAYFRLRLQEQRDKGKRGWMDSEACSKDYLIALAWKNFQEGDFLDTAILCMMLKVREVVGVK